MIKGFFFDLDGTLVDTYKADFLAYRDAIQEVLNLEIHEADFNKTHGQEMKKKLKVLAPGTSDHDARKIAAAKKNHYQKYLHETVPNQKLIDFLANFSDHHAMVLVTTAKKDNALKVLQKYNLKKYFSHTVFGDEVEHSKPHPEAYLTALKRSGLQPEEAIAFEDSRTGIEAAEAAGLAVIHVKRFASEP